MSLADTPDTPAKVTNSRYRKIKRILAGLLVTILLLGSMITFMLSTRPPWHVITGSGKPGEWVASVECPDNWQLKEDQSSYNYKGFTRFAVHRRPLTGMWAWWNRYVLRQSQNNTNTEIQCVIMPESGYNGSITPPALLTTRAERISHAKALVDAWEFGYKSASLRGTGYIITFKRVSHPLGPALEVAMDDMRSGNRGAGAANTAVGNHYAMLDIAPTEAGDFSGSIMVSYAIPETSSPLKPILERMAHSVRLVKK